MQLLELLGRGDSQARPKNNQFKVANARNEMLGSIYIDTLKFITLTVVYI